MVERVRSPDELKAKLFQALNQRPSPTDDSAPEQQVAVHSMPTWPTLASAAEQQLQRTLDVLQNATRVIEQVEHGCAKPAGMDAWENWDDKERKHQELAASVTESTTDLQTCLAKASRSAEAARRKITELCSRRFSAHTARARELQSISRKASHVYDISGQLAERLARARDELEERAEDYPGYYQAVYEVLLQAYDFIDQTHVSTLRMKRTLDRPQRQGSSRRSAVRSAEQWPDRDTAPSGPSAQARATEAVGVSIEQAGSTTPSEQGEAAELNSQPVLDGASWEQGETAEPNTPTGLRDLAG